MNLTSGQPFWTLKNGLLVNFPPLTADVSCDIVILGAGLSGAMIGQALTADGHDVVMIDARDGGFLSVDGWAA